MALAFQQGFIGVDEYLMGEQSSEIRYEYVDGVVQAMAGASINHNRIASNLVQHFGN